jgi:uncharacterized membrane protein
VSSIRGRVPQLDWLRGLVMVLMTLDHASGTFNAGRLMTDSTFLYRPGTPLPAAQFFTRWVTHVCAPAFVFLAGAALALSLVKRPSSDRFILTRGLLIAALDPIWMSPVFAPGHVLLQVLYAIGGSFVLMIPLRRLGDRTLLVIALTIILGGEAFTGAALAVSRGSPTLPVALLLTGGDFGWLIVGYPLLPWLAIMLLGWCFGRYLIAADQARAARVLVVVGLGALSLFVLVRGLDGYGNMLLLREDGSLVQWLHVSKYPPSLSYVSLELGLVVVALGLMLRRPVGGPLVVLGQAALFFYLLHVHLLTLAAWGLGLAHRGGLVVTYAATLGTLALLYPLSDRYRRYKREHPDGWCRYV